MRESGNNGTAAPSVGFQAWCWFIRGRQENDALLFTGGAANQIRWEMLGATSHLRASGGPIEAEGNRPSFPRGCPSILK